MVDIREAPPPYHSPLWILHVVAPQLVVVLEFLSNKNENGEESNETQRPLFLLLQKLAW